MKNTNEQEDWIDQYLLGRLSEEEQLQLERAIGEDPSLEEELGFKANLVEALHQLSNEKTERSIRTNMLVFFKNAAAVLLIATLGLTFLFQVPSLSDPVAFTQHTSHASNADWSDGDNLFREIALASDLIAGQFYPSSVADHLFEYRYAVR